jgi:hypothetical protein
VDAIGALTRWSSDWRRRCSSPWFWKYLLASMSCQCVEHFGWRAGSSTAPVSPRMKNVDVGDVLGANHDTRTVHGIRDCRARSLGQLNPGREGVGGQSNIGHGQQLHGRGKSAMRCRVNLRWRRDCSAVGVRHVARWQEASTRRLSGNGRWS